VRALSVARYLGLGFGPRPSRTLMTWMLASVAGAAGPDRSLGPVRDWRLWHGAVYGTDAASTRALSSCVAPSLRFRNVLFMRGPSRRPRASVGLLRASLRHPCPSLRPFSALLGLFFDRSSLASLGLRARPVSSALSLRSSCGRASASGRARASSPQRGSRLVSLSPPPG
jgi:hypothetical protein